LTEQLFNSIHDNGPEEEEKVEEHTEQYDNNEWVSANDLAIFLSIVVIVQADHVVRQHRCEKLVHQFQVANVSVLKRFEVYKIDHLDQGQDELDDDLQTEICRCKDCLNSEYCSPDHEKGRIEDRKSRVLT